MSSTAVCPYVTVKMAPHAFNNLIAMCMTVMRFGMLSLAAWRLAPLLVSPYLQLD
jgi:hypothetical protein